MKLLNNYVHKTNILKDHPDEVAEVFYNSLLNNKQALDYVLSRGVNLDIIKKYKLGYFPPHFNYWFPLLKGRIICPLFDTYGKVIAFAGRIYEPDRQKTYQEIENYYKDPIKREQRIEQWDRSKWINEPFSKSRYLFNLHFAKEHMMERGFVLVVEGYFDVLTLVSKGINNIVAVCGTNLSKNHTFLINRYCDNIITIYDGDKAGDKAAQSSNDILKSVDLISRNIFLPDGYDPDEFVMKVGCKQFNRILNNIIVNNTKKIKLNISE